MRAPSVGGPRLSAGPCADARVVRQDLLNAKNAADIMSALELVEQRRFVHVQGCSAKTGEGLEEGLSTLLRKVNETKA